MRIICANPIKIDKYIAGFPPDKPLPLGMIGRIVKFRAEENL